MKVFSEDEWINCSKCGTRFKVNSTSILFADYTLSFYIRVYCPRCKNGSARLPLDHVIK